MFKRILITTDFSMHARYALERAIQFAAFFKAELMCLHIINQPWYGGVKDEIDTENQELIKKAELAHAKELQEISNQYPMEFVVINGRIPDHIIHYINDKAIDLTFMGAHGAYYLHDYILGTNAESVIKLSNTPVQLIRTKPGKPYHRVVVSTDFSDISKKAVEMAYKVYPNAEFLLLHVADLWYETTRVTDDMHLELQKNLVHFLGNCDVDESRFTIKFIGGYPADDIARSAEEWGADLLVIGTRGHSLLHYVLVGRVGDRLLRISKTDMLVVPP